MQVGFLTVAMVQPCVVVRRSSSAGSETGLLTSARHPTPHLYSLASLSACRGRLPALPVGFPFRHRCDAPTVLSSRDPHHIPSWPRSEDVGCC